MFAPSTKNIDRIEPDLQNNLKRDLNILVRAIIADLSTEENSPVDTDHCLILLDRLKMSYLLVF